jgi:HEPN domain-containing protein
VKWSEHAQRLRRKAAIDEQAMMILIADASSADEVVGFHAQQAVEKLLKAALSQLQVAFKKTHDLVQLLNLLETSGIAAPHEVTECRRLGPYAVFFRYEDISDEGGSTLDRTWVVACVRKTREWVDTLLARAEEPPE